MRPTEQQLLEFLLRDYDLQGEIKSLMGEVDYNYLVQSDLQKYLLKIGRPHSDHEKISAQHEMLAHLHRQSFPLAIPRLVKSVDGSSITWLTDKQATRVYHWVEGQVIGSAHRSSQLYAHWGQVAGQMSHGLKGFNHPAAHRSDRWNPSQTLESRVHLNLFKTSEQKETATYFWNLFESTVLPQLPELRKSVNHSDLHEFNLIRSQTHSHQISGIIDFGDALYSETINELAIACAYAGMMNKRPLRALFHVIRGYHSIFPITEQELNVLFSLVAARLLITVSAAAENHIIAPENDYLFISENAAWELLFQLKNIPPRFAHYTFRHACFLEPCPMNSKWASWYDENKNEFKPIISVNATTNLTLNLSVASPHLGHYSNYQSTDRFEKKLQRLFEDQRVESATGGYGETRPIYNTDAYMIEGNDGPVWRTVHLGLDIWKPAGTAAYSPFKAKVYSIAEHTTSRDYGPTIILSHEYANGQTFYTLYGHLSRSSLDNIDVGDLVEAGSKFATLGTKHENGNWPAHLHFQIILDIFDWKGDFPGVCLPDEKEIWTSLCPDTSRLFPHLIQSPQPNSSIHLIKRRSQFLGPNLSLSYDQPLHIVRGQGQYLIDADGQRYLDTVNNVAHVGHAHPRIVNVLKDQNELLNTNTRYLHENILNYAESLLNTFPNSLDVVYFVNSGSEANELALRMARSVTGRQDMLALEMGYHGNTAANIEVSSYKFDRAGGEGKSARCHILPIPDTFRGAYSNGPFEESNYITVVQSKLAALSTSTQKIAGFICESMLSCAGQIVLPPDYLSTIFKAVKSLGGLCIADEVQVGFGRLGNCFWGFELQNVIPDIVTLGKPMGNGHPLGAVITTKEIASQFSSGMEYFNTYGGNPVSCAVGQTVLNVIHDEQLQMKALTLGNKIKKEFMTLKNEFPLIGDVRGHGLFLGVEFAKDQSTKQPATAEAKYFINRMRSAGVLMSTDGPKNNVLKIKPPMCIQESDIEFLMESTLNILKEID